MNSDTSILKNLNLWEFISGGLVNGKYAKVEAIFKLKKPRKYIQVKSATINNGSQVILFCTDVTRIKEIEMQGQKMRGTFFSSVAHELRTPLNSVIPILRMILASLTPDMPNYEKNKNYLVIVLNSSLHLQSVIEDALDITRIENNKFTLFKDFFNIRETIVEVCDVMRFQTDQKELGFEVEITERVPYKLFSDVKRFKQILFNLIGNAIKFTFEGKIKVLVDYNVDCADFTASVEDTGVGISSEEMLKLFRFFG